MSKQNDDAAKTRGVTPIPVRNVYEDSGTDPSFPFVDRTIDSFPF